MAQILPFSRNDRRAQPVRVLQPVALVHDDGSAATGTVINLSHAGVASQVISPAISRTIPR